jgi:hypothetical protein
MRRNRRPAAVLRGRFLVNERVTEGPVRGIEEFAVARAGAEYESLHASLAAALVCALYNRDPALP